MRFGVGEILCKHPFAESLSSDEYEHATLVIGNCGCVEVERVFLIFESHCVLALRCAEAVVIYAVVLIGVGELFPFFGAVICRVEESVLVPCRIGKFSPFDMVVEQLACLGVYDEYFCPVGAVSRNSVSYIFAIVTHGQAGEGHSAVFGQCIRVKEDFGLSVGCRRAVYDRLVFQAVVL